MAILLRQLCEKASYLYGMRILAGENGTGNIVQWIHTLEDVETGGFIHGGELIFTTGIARGKPVWWTLREIFPTRSSRTKKKKKIWRTH